MATVDMRKGRSSEASPTTDYGLPILTYQLERDLIVDPCGSMSDCCGRDVEYDVENEVWFCGLCGEPCGVL